jgi:NADPH:quinone reductase-like Zn-dependent oxidoreductase
MDAGGIGQTLIQIAKHTGARVIVVARRPARLEIARKMTADQTINSTAQNVPEAVKALTGGLGVDAVIDTFGSDESLLCSCFINVFISFACDPGPGAP